MGLPSGVIIPFQYREAKKLLMIGVAEENREINIWDLKNVVRAAFGIYNFEFRNKKIGFHIPDELLVNYLGQSADLSNFVVEVVQDFEKVRPRAKEQNINPIDTMHFQSKECKSSIVKPQPRELPIASVKKENNSKITDINCGKIKSYQSQNTNSEQSYQDVCIPKIKDSTVKNELEENHQKIRKSSDETETAKPNNSTKRIKTSDRSDADQTTFEISDDDVDQPDGNSSMKKRRVRLTVPEKGIYLKYIQENIAMQTHETSHKSLEPHWEKLAKLLNSSRTGHLKTPSEWRKTFDRWRYQTQSKHIYNSTLVGSATQCSVDYKFIHPIDKIAYSMWMRDIKAAPSNDLLDNSTANEHVECQNANAELMLTTTKKKKKTDHNQ